MSTQRYQGFVGPSNRFFSVNVDAERTLNVYPQPTAPGTSSSPLTLALRPGLVPLVTLAGIGVRGVFFQDGQLYAVAGSKFYTIASDWTATEVGDVGTDGGRVSMVSNGTAGHQVLIISNGNGFIYDTTAATLTAIASGFPAGQALSCAYMDGYFIAFTPTGFQISDLLDGTVWDAADVAQRSQGSDPIIGGLVNQLQVVLIGEQTSELWYDSGAVDFPFQPIPGGFLEQGGIAPQSLTKFDNAYGWIGRNVQGSGVAFRNGSGGTIPQRISTHAIESIWDGYSTIADAEAWCTEVEGHLFWVINFPTADATWVYDVATNLWHEWSTHQNGGHHVFRGRCYAFGYGRRILGDTATGQLYALDTSTYDDDTDPIVWLRRGPTIGDGLQYAFFEEFWVDCEVGIGLATGQGSNPLLMMRYSNDAGQTWSNERSVSIGAQGNYDARAVFQRCGRARLGRRVFEVSGSDPVPWAINDAWLRVTPGTGMS